MSAMVGVRVPAPRAQKFIKAEDDMSIGDCLKGLGLLAVTFSIVHGIYNLNYNTKKYHSETSTFEALLGSSYTPDGGICSNPDLVPYVIETGSGAQYQGVAKKIDSPTDFDYERVLGGLEKIVTPTENGDEIIFERSINCETLGEEQKYTSFKDVPEHLQGVYKEAFETGSQRVGEIFGAFSKQALQAYEDKLEEEGQEKVRELQNYKEVIDNL